MKVGRLLSPVHTLGPGDRVVLWTQGCGKNCPGCETPELQPSSASDMDEGLLADIIRRAAKSAGCTGLTVSGGDPMEQAPSLLKLLKLLRPDFDDILVYTGYTIDQVAGGIAGPEGAEALKWIDVLIDGPYVDELNTPDCVLRGSENQEIRFLTPSLEPEYTEYMKMGRSMETFIHGKTLIFVGIPNRRNDNEEE